MQQPDESTIDTNQLLARLIMMLILKERIALATTPLIYVKGNKGLSQEH
jgi:hypothetical protein